MRSSGNVRRFPAFIKSPGPYPDLPTQTVPLASGLPFFLLLCLTICTFLNIPNRSSALAVTHPTLILVVLLLALLAFHYQSIKDRFAVSESRWLLVLIAYIVASLPLVRWPGSVIGGNFAVLVRSVVFFFFVVAFVDSLKRLNTFLLVFLFSQLARCIEPLAMHLNSGYWGGQTYFDGEFMQRLAGAPADPVNANGLAFVILTVVPFFHYWATYRNRFWSTISYLLGMPALIYALTLTASRSGLIGFACILVGFVWFSKVKIRWLAAFAIAAVFALPILSGSLRDRYQSLFDNSSRQNATVQGRISGLSSNFEVFTARPVFGFGLGTSLEANFNVVGETHYAHNLYLETLIELGILGFAIFAGYLFSVFRSVRRLLRLARDNTFMSLSGDAEVLQWLPKALFVWVVMCAIFSIAAYGLSEYHWYLIGGLATTTLRFAVLARKNVSEESQVEPVRGRPGSRPAFRGSRAPVQTFPSGSKVGP